jgi:heptosyltransferase-2
MRIAIFWPNWIGDAVMATPAVRALRQQFPGAHILGILKPYISGVIEGSPWLDDQVFLDSGGSWRHSWPIVAARLRREHVDLAVLFPNSLRSALVARVGGCRRRVGYSRYGRSVLLTDRLTPVRDARGKLLPCPIIDAYNQLAIQAGCSDPGYRMELFTTARDEAAAETIWRQAGFSKNSEVVCLNPGAAFGSAKHWPAAYFARLARSLIDYRGSSILVLCGPGERDLARRIENLIGRQRVSTLADQPVSIGLTKACIRRASLLVTTDSGPRHFAAAFDRPVVTLFGPTHIEWTETFYSRAIHLQRRVTCGPCQQRVCPLDHRCMKLLTPSVVYAAAEKLLRQGQVASARAVSA